MDVDGRAGVGPVAVVQVVEVAAVAAVEDSGAAKSEGVIAADGEAAGVDGTGLRRAVELELEVRGDVAGSALLVGQDTVGKSQGERGVGWSAGFLTLECGSASAL